MNIKAPFRYPAELDKLRSLYFAGLDSWFLK